MSMEEGARDYIGGGPRDGHPHPPLRRRCVRPLTVAANVANRPLSGWGPSSIRTVVAR